MSENFEDNTMFKKSMLTISIITVVYLIIIVFINWFL